MESTMAEHKELLQELLARRPLPFDGNLRNALPTYGGVYHILERGLDWERSVYIGKSGNLRQRIYSNHFMGNRRASTLKRKLIREGLYADENAVKQYLKDKCSVQFLVVDEGQRRHFEHFAVAILRPRYND